jgi:hypothetical protein
MVNGAATVTETSERRTVTFVWFRLMPLSEEFPMIVKESLIEAPELPLQKLREEPLSQTSPFPTSQTTPITEVAIAPNPEWTAAIWSSITALSEQLRAAQQSDNRIS